jgi:hypothetical protein
MILDCALGYRSSFEVVVALGSPVQSTLVDPMARDRPLAMARCRCRL